LARLRLALTASSGAVRLPVTLYDLVRLAIVLIRKYRQQLVRRFAFIKRFDQRLNDRHGAVVRTRVAPRFEIVRSGYVPVTEVRSLVFVLAEMNAELNFLKSLESEL